MKGVEEPALHSVQLTAPKLPLKLPATQGSHDDSPTVPARTHSFPHTTQMERGTHTHRHTHTHDE